MKEQTNLKGFRSGLLVGFVLAGYIGYLWGWGSGYDEAELIISKHLPKTECGAVLFNKRPTSSSWDY